MNQKIKYLPKRRNGSSKDTMQPMLPSSVDENYVFTFGRISKTARRIDASKQALTHQEESGIPTMAVVMPKVIPVTDRGFYGPAHTSNTPIGLVAGLTVKRDTPTQSSSPRPGDTVPALFRDSNLALLSRETLLHPNHLRRKRVRQVPNERSGVANHLQQLNAKRQKIPHVPLASDSAHELPGQHYMEGMGRSEARFTAGENQPNTIQRPGFSPKSTPPIGKQRELIPTLDARQYTALHFSTSESLLYDCFQEFAHNQSYDDDESSDSFAKRNPSEHPDKNTNCLSDPYEMYTHSSRQDSKYYKTPDTVNDYSRFAYPNEVPSRHQVMRTSLDMSDTDIVASMASDFPGESSQQYHPSAHSSSLTDESRWAQYLKISTNPHYSFTEE